MLTMKIKVKLLEQFNEKAFKVHSLNHYIDKSCLCIYLCTMLRTSAFLQPVVRGQVYIFKISPPLPVIYLKQQLEQYIRTV